MTCKKCRSSNLDVNGIYYVCKDCGNIDDSTFDMIMRRCTITPKEPTDMERLVRVSDDLMANASHAKTPNPKL